MLRRALALVASLALVALPGCMGAQPTRYVRVSGDVTPANVALLADAIGEWNRACGEEILQLGEGGDLDVHFVDRFEGEDDPKLALVKDGEREHALDGSWAGQRTGDRIELFRMPDRDEDAARSTAAHELGHYLTGKSHPSTPEPSIMRVLGTEGRTLGVTTVDVDRIALNGYFCPRAGGR